jgi:glutaconate CoA-transferase subunit B
LKLERKVVEEEYSAHEMMTIAAARAVSSEDVCFVGIGAPSVACNLARRLQAPGITLIYESGTIGTEPDVLPLSIGDPELCETALTTVSVPEMFAYWLQGGRITVGFLGGAQIDRYANINSTVIGDYQHPRVRLPGAGGAPEIATSCRQIYIIMRQSRRTFIPKVDFITSFGHGEGGDHRQRLGITTAGPTLVVTDLCLMRPDPLTKDLTVVSIHPGVTREQVVEATGWPIRFAAGVAVTPPPAEIELVTLRDLELRTKVAHGEQAAE